MFLFEKAFIEEACVIIWSLQKTFSSEVFWKWLQWVKVTPLWPSSAWTSAKHWPAKARPSSSPSRLDPASASPLTQGTRCQTWKPRGWYQPGRNQAHQPSGEMQGAGLSFWTRNKAQQPNPLSGHSKFCPHQSLHPSVARWCPWGRTLQYHPSPNWTVLQLLPLQLLELLLQALVHLRHMKSLALVTSVEATGTQQQHTGRPSVTSAGDICAVTATLCNSAMPTAASTIATNRCLVTMLSGPSRTRNLRRGTAQTAPAHP